MKLKFIKEVSEGKFSRGVVAFLFCFSILLVRAGARVRQGEFWAEDANIFLNEALQWGWRSVFMPHASYFHVIQRVLLLSLYSLVPLEVLPSAIAFVCLAVAALITSQWASEKYAWLLPSRLYRFGLCAVLCLAPGLGEMLGNLCNLNWFFTLWIALVLLQDPEEKIRVWHWFLCGALFFSIGTGVLLVPLAVWRYWRKPKILVPVLVFVAVYVGVLLSARDPSRTEVLQIQNVPWGEWFKTYLRQFRISVLLQPLLGDALTIKASLGKSVRWGNRFAIATLLVLVPWLVRTARHKAVQATLLFLFSFSAWVFLVWVGRTRSIEAFQLPLAPWFFQNRYSFPMTWGAFLLWFMALHSAFQPRLHRSADRYLKVGALILFVGWMTYTSAYRFKVPAYGAEKKWAKNVAVLRLAITKGLPEPVKVESYPGKAFDFVYQPK